MSEPPDYASQLATFLEDTAKKVRGMTVDRAVDIVTWVAIGLVVATIAFLALFWVFIGLFRALGALIGVELTYAIVGGILLVAGAFVWSKRIPAEIRSDDVESM